MVYFPAFPACISPPRKHRYLHKERDDVRGKEDPGNPLGLEAADVAASEGKDLPCDLIVDLRVGFRGPGGGPVVGPRGVMGKDVWGRMCGVEAW